MGAMQQQLKSIAEQLQNYNRNKSILGEGPTASLERGSSSRVTAIQPVNEGNSTQYNAIHRMEFPLFNGEEARTWIRRCNRYFQVIPIPEEQKVPLASVYMQGKAELWFQGHLEKSGMPSWSELTIIILRKFISGLKEEIKGYVATMNPTTLDQTIVLARRQENIVNALLRKTNQQQKNNQSKAPFKPQNKSLPYKPSFKPSFKPRDEASQPRRFLTEAEVRARKEKNLCYKCDEPYSPGHRCRIRQVHMMLFEEEAKAYEEAEDQIEEPPDSEDAIVSFHAMRGNVSSKTLRINGQVNGKDMHVLIDSGSTHCFIDEKVVQVLGCRLEPTTPMTVRIADGGETGFPSVKVTITQSGKKIVLKALTERGHLKTLSAYSLSKLLRRGNYGIKGHIYVINRDRMPDERDPRLLGLMHQFKDVFQEPKTLPPERIIEHHIELVPDAIPKKQHPYRYAYGQKTEIEKIVKDMLESGIIRTSQRSFASPVLLVKKKDGGWRLCVDYRKFVLVFFDDILIYSKEWDLHLLHLEKGVATDPQKIEYMKEWPLPTSIKALRGFLGLTGYYRKFIKGYGAISKPLTSLLKKDGFIWNPEAEAAFNHLKEVMTSVPVLALPNFSQPFIVETDACGKGIGAVLMQEGRHIASLSKALATKNMGLSTYKKGFLALLLAITKWKHYLQGNHFIIRTDQKSLKHILDQRIDSILQQKWITKLLGLSYEVQYKKGSENRAADALSRINYDKEEPQANAITTQVPLWMQDIEGSYEGNTLFQIVVQAKVLDNQAFPDYSYEAGVLRRKGKICVGDVNAWVKECEVCQRAKHENNPYPGLLQPLPIPDQAWSCISMNFIEGLPSSEGKDSILGQSLHKQILEGAIQHGWSVFEMSSAYHPQTDGQTERVNQCLENYLRCLKATPFQALYGYPPHQLTIGPYMQNHHSEVEELMQERVKPYRQTVVSLRKQLKLSAKYYGPYKVLERIRKVAYRLALPPSSKIHPVFHVSLLKKKIGFKYFPSVSLPDFEDEVFKQLGEDYKDMAAKFPGFDPWGQGSKKGGRDVVSSSRNASLYGKRAIEEVNLDRQIKDRFELGVSKENTAVLTKAEKDLALPDSNATFTPDCPIKVKSISHPIEGEIELGIEAAHSKACDVVTCELGHDLLEGKFGDCDVGINSTNGQAPRHVEGEERV
ncbi:UNVERIFIED_CONTAM: Retrovirus-related Pol polyprotein from transposon.6 [Sesamum latifolium]|uniref:Retrovirus-related Pol polyprotein from transposon.6 n=1 Tax=Sesamum latifolium TaxID=2727402 RepID=A0AAW2UUS2_9LAMI